MRFKDDLHFKFGLITTVEHVESITVELKGRVSDVKNDVACNGSHKPGYLKLSNINYV